LLYPIQHRGESAQADLAVLRSRDHLVKVRTQLVNHVRDSVKSIGERLPKCDTDVFARRIREALPPLLRPALEPMVEQIAAVTEAIDGFDQMIEWELEQKYPGTDRLRQVKGVGPLTAMAYVLVLEDPKRFPRVREVGSHVGLVPRLDDTGQSQPQLRITKAGDELLRRYLVQAAHYILGPFGPDTDLRRWGVALAERGGKNAKKRAAVAVARKLSVLLMRLWASGAVYEPLRNAKAREQAHAGQSVPAEAENHMAQEEPQVA
jgi:transposase